jgi:hypothetical protein
MSLAVHLTVPSLLLLLLLLPLLLLLHLLVLSTQQVPLGMT